MDIPQLIREVHRHPAIWNQKSTHYYNREVVSKTWERVAKACDMPHEAVKSKWKHLRDNFRKELKKCLKDSGYQSDPERYESGWVWFKSLNFLVDQLSAKRLTVGAKNGQSQHEPSGTEEDNPSKQQNSLPTTQDSTCGSFQDGDDFEFKPSTDTDESQLLSENDSTPSNNNTPGVYDDYLQADIKRKRHLYNSLENEPHVKRKRNKLGGSSRYQENDDTYHFLMSLMTPLNHLPYDRQMFVRLKMQEIISSEIMQIHNNQMPYPVELKAVGDANCSLTITPNDLSSDSVDYTEHVN